MPAPTIPSIFSQLGYEVFGQRYGVYHLRRPAAEGAPYFDGIGLLFCEAPLASADSVSLFVLNACHADTGAPLPGASIERMQRQWGGLDARRLAESGLECATIVRAGDTLGRVQREGTVMRPGNDARVRHFVQMESGDVVCLN